jgi:flagellar hook-associated protein 2
MAAITFGGLASGLDTNSIITAVMNAEKIPYNQLQRKQTNLNSAKDTVSALSSKFSALKAASLALSTADGFSSLKAGSSSTGVVATVTGAGSPAAYSVKVTSVAREQRNHSATFASASDDLNQTGQLAITIGSTTSNVTVEATDSLTDIAAKINGSGARVNASVLYDGTSYRMVVRGLDTGAINAVSFGETGTALGLASPAVPVQTASDAVLLVDGVTIRRPTNQVVGAIPGVTLAITKASETAVDVTIDASPDGLIQKVQAFVTAYNDVVQAGQAAAGYGTLKPANAELAGDQTIRSALDRLSRVTGSQVPGTSGKYRTMGTVGLGADRDGKIVFDQDKFKAALASNESAVRALFVKDTFAGTTGIMSAFMTTTDGLATGTNALLKNRIESLGRMSTRLTDDMDAQQRRLDMYEVQLRARFTKLEETVSKFKSQGDAITAALMGGSR